MNVKELFAALEEKDLSTLKQITTSIKSFDREKSLKRSKTFDRSALTLDLIKIPMSIQHFDRGSLRHVDSLDKSSPLHIYQLLRSDSAYSNYLETPVNVPSDSTEQIPSGIQLNVDQARSTESDNSPANTEMSVRNDTSSNIDKMVPENDKTNVPSDISQTNNDDIETFKHSDDTTHIETVENLIFQANKSRDPDDTAADSSQTLLNGSYVVVQESGEKMDNPVSEETDNFKQTTASESLNTDSNISQFLADYDKISIDSERLVEKDLGKHENDIDGLSLCSNLTTEEVVIGSSQSEMGNDIYQKVVNKIQSDKDDTSDAKVSDSKDNQSSGIQSSNQHCMHSNQDIEDVDRMHTDATTLIAIRTDAHEDNYQSEVSYRQKNAGEVENQGTAANDITKIIDDAFLENDIDGQ